jgi:hypothetical protein
MIESKNFLIDPDDLSQQMKDAKFVTRRQKLAEQQRLKEAQEKNKRWVYLSLFVGVSMGIGNYLNGLHLSKAGMMGAALTGPISLLITSSYRIR